MPKIICPSHGIQFATSVCPHIHRAMNDQVKIHFQLVGDRAQFIPGEEGDAVHELVRFYYKKTPVCDACAEDWHAVDEAKEIVLTTGWKIVCVPCFDAWRA
jgi:hypothetical protein